MRQILPSIIYFFLFSLASLSNKTLCAHGFASETLIKKSTSNKPLEKICHRVAFGKSEKVLSSCLKSWGHTQVKRVKAVSKGSVNCHCRIIFDDKPEHDIICTPTQEFYLPNKKQWLPSCELKQGDKLLSHNGTHKTIQKISLIPQPLTIFGLEVKGNHNFFVSYYEILTHNMAIPVGISLGLNIAFGSGGAAAGATVGSFFGPVTLFGGLIIGGIVGILANTYLKDKSYEYHLECDFEALNALIKENDQPTQGQHINNQLPTGMPQPPEDPDDKNNKQQVKLISKSKNKSASNVNAQINLNKKMRALQNIQKKAVHKKKLKDGRIRYYMQERVAKSNGLTRGASYVVEHNPKTGKVRSWNECYDHQGNVNRIHPKTIDGQDLKAQHYPPTKEELRGI